MAQIPFRILSSKSSTVWLFTTKNLSLVEELSSRSASATSASSSLAGDALSEDTIGSEIASAGVDALAAAPIEFLRSLLVNPTFWNLESCIFAWAAAHVSSSLKLAKAQLVFDMRNTDSGSGASLQTCKTRFINSVCGGRFPIHIACPVIYQLYQYCARELELPVRRGFLGGPLITEYWPLVESIELY